MNTAINQLIQFALNRQMIIKEDVYLFCESIIRFVSS